MKFAKLFLATAIGLGMNTSCWAGFDLPAMLKTGTVFWGGSLVGRSLITAIDSPNQDYFELKACAIGIVTIVGCCLSKDPKTYLFASTTGLASGLATEALHVILFDQKKR